MQSRVQGCALAGFTMVPLPAKILEDLGYFYHCTWGPVNHIILSYLCVFMLILKILIIKKEFQRHKQILTDTNRFCFGVGMDWDWVRALWG
jgi:uncharacterized membrane protein YcgQ (UPF0703/DUF1980 family)